MIRRFPIAGGNRLDWNDPTKAWSKLPGALTYLPPTKVIGVDPATSAPNAWVGIAFSDTDVMRFLRPGEFLTLAESRRDCRIFNPLPRMLSRAATPSGGFTFLGGVSLGGVSLLVSDDLRSVEEIRASGRRALPSAQVIGAAKLTATNPSLLDSVDSLLVYTAGLERLRLRIVPLGAGDLPIAVPALLGGTIKLWQRFRLPLNAAATAIDMNYLYATRVEDGAFPIPTAFAAAWQRDDTTDVQITATKTIIEFDVGAADMIAVQVEALAGCAGIFAIAEGV